ncbi:MAG TPA: alpha/beta fold hydrolase [Candidatus Omnitrophota bacterium]|nr:alpha/beta fold hydrolase [Candidatus Omnitrophota bacterium]
MPKVKLNNVSLYYEIHGDGYPLLLISGINADSASWAGVCDKFAKHLRVIIFDNRASGRSGMPKGKYSISDMAADTTGLLDHLKIKKCHVIGHSMGGYIAQEMALNYPERIERLVLEATAPASSIRNNVLLKDLLRRFQRGRDNEELMRSWTYWLFSPKAFERKNYIEAFIKHASAHPYAQSPEGFKSQIDAVESFNVSSDIKNIKAETLVIAGSDDILIYPSESMKLAKGIRGSIYEEIKDTGHCVHVENPKAFLSKVVRFLKR